jgi:hypothetical protein
MSHVIHSTTQNEEGDTQVEVTQDPSVVLLIQDAEETEIHADSLNSFDTGCVFMVSTFP